MTSTGTQQHTTTAPDDGWRDAGAAWGHAALDWAYLFEPYSRDATEHVFATIGVGPGTELFDLACGSGYATARAARRGANVTGLDASLELLDIARRRTPGGRFDAGSMFALPYDDAGFDVVTSFNGIWGGCEVAMAEANRVLKPGGMIAVTFWGPGDKLDFRDMFITLGGATASTKDEMIGLASIGAPGVAETMFADAGFEMVERGATQALHEIPDTEAMWRCLRSPGLMKPALDLLGEEALRALLMATVDPFRAADGSYRVVNELTHVIGRKAA
ncbi:MAG: methyltransferase domain-containing protein [Acidimicrobiales bacterium]